MPPSERNEVAEKRLREASPAGRRTDGERMHVSDRFGLREKTKQIRDDLGSVANDERRVSKLVNEEWMVQVAGIPRTPEFMELVENLGVVLVGTDRDFYGNAHRRPAGMVARKNLLWQWVHLKRGGRLALRADHCTQRNRGKTGCRRADFQRVSLSRRLAFHARCEADHTTFGKSCENLNCLFYEYGKAM